MPVSLYPNKSLSFPWLTPGDLETFPYVIFPNWRFDQRSALAVHASTARVRHARMANARIPEHFYMDFDVLTFLTSIAVPTKAVIVVQDYLGGSFKTEVVLLDKPSWSSTPYESVPRIDYYELRKDSNNKAVREEDLKFYWGPLLLCVAPLHKDTPHTPTEIQGMDNDLPSLADSPFMNILDLYGVPKLVD